MIIFPLHTNRFQRNIFSLARASSNRWKIFKSRNFQLEKVMEDFIHESWIELPVRTHLDHQTITMKREWNQEKLIYIFNDNRKVSNLFASRCHFSDHKQFLKRLSISFTCAHIRFDETQINQRLLWWDALLRWHDFPKIRQAFVV